MVHINVFLCSKGAAVVELFPIVKIVALQAM